MHDRIPFFHNLSTFPSFIWQELLAARRHFRTVLKVVDEGKNFYILIMTYIQLIIIIFNINEFYKINNYIFLINENKNTCYT